jgi:beta-1,4-mannosyl-glycoprotein beta-1,4-N-acetylglucosaminyltransferase
MIKIVDCFSFFDELEMLSFRLKELNEVVDYFVLVESALSHSGKVKELIYQNNKHLFEEYNHKIVHMLVDDVPKGREFVDAWVREEFQREYMVKGVDTLNLRETDLVIIGDVDEIPNTDLLKQIKIYNGLNIFKDGNNHEYFTPNPKGIEMYNEGILGFIQDYYYYNLECKHIGIWWQSRILTYQKLKELKHPDKIRRLDIDQNYYKKGGWHFSYFFGIDSIIRKIQNFTHQEYNNEHYLNRSRLQYRIDNNKDLYDRDFIEMNRIPISENEFLPYNYKMLL